MERRRAWSFEDDDGLRHWAAAGYSRHAIALKLGRRDSSVDVRAREIEVPLSIRARRSPNTKRPRDNAKQFALKACIDSLQRQLKKVEALARELARVEARAALSHARLLRRMLSADVSR
jgi:hypothetical protein